MPAAAVIPAPIAYIKVVAVKKLVVELQTWLGGLPSWRVLSGRALPLGEPACPSLGVSGNQDFYLEKIRVFKAGLCRDILAWNNGIGRASLFCWFLGSPQWLIGTVGGISIRPLEVKFLDRPKTNYCESICQGCFH